MVKTVGILNLKIAQLEQQLNILQQRQILSQPYPDYQKQLGYQDQQVRLALQHLMQDRDQMSNGSEFGQVLN